jgi:hypothetical protein
MVQHGRKVRMNADNSQANGRSNPVLKSESIVGAAENLPSAKTNRDGEAQRGLRILVKMVLKRLNVLTNWLEWKKTGSVIGLISLAAGLAFWLWPRPASSNLAVIPNKGGTSPSRYLHGKSLGQIADTAIILFSKSTADKYGAVNHAQFKYTASCDSRYSVMRRPGAYMCILATGDFRDIGNPCFGVGPKQVTCEMPAGFMMTLSVDSSNPIENYSSSLSVAAHFYPWRLELANGLNCSWSWLEWPGQEHFHGGWICAKSTAAITIAPGLRNHVRYYGTNFSEINYAEILDSQQAYYAEDLVQGEQDTWSILLEGPGNFGVFHRISVLQAWY